MAEMQIMQGAIICPSLFDSFLARNARNLKDQLLTISSVVVAKNLSSRRLCVLI
jgi:hypothetical protein